MRQASSLSVQEMSLLSYGCSLVRLLVMLYQAHICLQTSISPAEREFFPSSTHANIHCRVHGHVMLLRLGLVETEKLRVAMYKVVSRV